jgi:hypothetical protein
MGLGFGLLCAAPAAAEDVPPVSHAAMGKESVQRGVQGPAGLFHARAMLHINMSSDRVGEPISLAPDLHYSFSDTFELGLVHNLPMGWQTLPGVSLCLADGCAQGVYPNFGIDALYGLAFGSFHLSLHSTFYVLRTEAPRWLMLTVGAATKIHFSDTAALYLDPQVGVALSQRDGGNENQLYLPLELQFQLTPTSVFKLLGGVYGPLSGFTDSYLAPFGVGAVFNVNENIDLGARFSFDNLLGNQPPGVERTDLRSLSFLMNFRM